MRAILVNTAMAFGLASCGCVPGTMQVGFTPDAMERTPGAGKQLKLTVSDERSDPTRAGVACRGGGFGTPLQVAGSVDSIVSDAVRERLEQAGFSVRPAALYELHISIKQFWLEWPPGLGITVTAAVTLDAELECSGVAVWAVNKTGQESRSGFVGGGTVRNSTLTRFSPQPYRELSIAYWTRPGAWMLPLRLTRARLTCPPDPRLCVREQHRPTTVTWAISRWTGGIEPHWP